MGAMDSATLCGEISQVSQVASDTSNVQRLPTVISHRSMDLNMMTFFRSRERSLEEWRSIVHQANSQLSMKTFALNPAGHVIDIQWAD
jgi:hypothetical protein